MSRSRRSRPGDEEQSTLFAAKAARGAPLADRLRPRTLDEVVGQEALLGPGRPLRVAIERDRLRSIILFGPPGCGKTTLARVVAAHTRARFVPFSAVLAGIREVRELMSEAATTLRESGRRTVVFIDEIHRFNRAQQDAFLPFVEAGDIVLIGATTENPSFALNDALLSRMRVFTLEPLGEAAVRTLLDRALEDSRGVPDAAPRIDPEALAELTARSRGDARLALDTLGFLVEATASQAALTDASKETDDEVAADAGPGAQAAPSEPPRITAEAVREALEHARIPYDRSGDEHFNLLSALHKSLRNSDPDAAVHWLARLLEAGEDPLVVARRMVCVASEDVGLADPFALQVAMAAKEAAHFLGLPEGRLALSQAAIYLATAPKSNSAYRAYAGAAADVAAGKTGPVPMALRNAPTRWMKDSGYGAGYRDAHDEASGVADLECLPEGLEGRRYYEPSDRGFEQRIRDRIDAHERARREASEASEASDASA